jgi:cytochrome c oxidase assembly protein subunit 15
MQERFTISPQRFTQLAWFTLGLLIVVVVTGAGVRLTRSGLGCPDWPKCHGGTLPPANINSIIEYGNRVLSGLVSVVGIAVWILSFRRRPRRRDLTRISAFFPLFLITEAALGALTVKHELDPGYVMAHFGVGMLVLIASVALVWRCRSDEPREPSELPRPLWAMLWTLLPLGGVVIFAGTVATAAGPHAGGQKNQPVNRLDFKGDETLRWAVHAHGHIAAALGVLALASWLYIQMMQSPPTPRSVFIPLTVTTVLLGVQGLIGHIQWDNQLPAGLVFVHVSLACATWVTLLWSIAATGTRLPVRQPSTRSAAATASGTNAA